MAEKGVKSSSKESSGKRRMGWKIALLLALLVLLAGLTVLFFLLSYRFFFSENARFTLRAVELRSVGYWEEKGTEFANRIGLRIGRDNLFALSLPELRAHVAKTVPNVLRCEVERVLPDTLLFRMVERIPRARLGSALSEWVVDSDGVVISGKECVAFSGVLPILTGFPRTLLIRPGKTLPEAENALALLMTAVRNYPDISILAIDVSSPDKLVFFMRYADSRTRRVIMPSDRRHFKFLLNALQSAVVNARQRGDTRTTFDLSFDGDVILR